MNNRPSNVPVILVGWISDYSNSPQLQRRRGAPCLLPGASHISRPRVHVLDAGERSSKMSPSDSSPTGFGMAVFLRVACVVALTPTTHAVYPQNNVNTRRESAFTSSPPGSLRALSIAKRGWCHTSRTSSTTPTAAGVRPHATRPLSRRHSHGRACSYHNGGGAVMMSATTSASATATSVDSPAAAVLATHGMRRGDWEALVRAGEVVTLKEGALLMSQGESYDEPEDRKVYLIVSGGFRLEVRGKAVARVQVGDFVGEGV